MVIRMGYSNTMFFPPAYVIVTGTIGIHYLFNTLHTGSKHGVIRVSALPRKEEIKIDVFVQ